MIRVLAIVVFNKYQSLTARWLPRALQINEGRLYPSLNGQLVRTPSARLDLQPGELVRIKRKEEIEATLDRNNKNRGLSFDIEMVRYCGRVARVVGRVERLIDEHTGRMLEINSDCIILEGAVCRSDYHRFCTRSTYSYWREIWLERVEG